MVALRSVMAGHGQPRIESPNCNLGRTIPVVLVGDGLTLVSVTPPSVDPALRLEIGHALTAWRHFHVDVERPPGFGIERLANIEVLQVCVLWDEDFGAVAQARG